MSIPINPLIIGKVIKHYYSDIHRFKTNNYDKIKNFRDKKLRQLIKYAYTVPLYNEKFKKTGIKPEDIHTIEDIQKLPVITRKDMVKNFPDKILPPKINKEKLVLLNTSGSTRDPVKYYTDQFTLMKSNIIYVRSLRNFGFKWNKTKFSIIANFYSGTGPTSYFSNGAAPTLKPFFSLDNFQLINSDDDLKHMINQLDKFQPEFLAGFSGPLRHMALLKKQGYGANLNPKCIISSGVLLYKSIRKEIEDAFNTKVYDFFGSTEAGPISFECEKGKYHINSDWIKLETIDKNKNMIPEGKPGILALTRLYGGGTPVIRYTGMGDIITLKKGKCNCGLQTELIQKIHGRIKECIVLPNEKLIYPDETLEIPGEIMNELQTNKIHMIQLIQKKLDEIKILVIINDKERKQEPTNQELFEELKDRYEKTFNNRINVTVKKVKKLKTEKNNPDSTPAVLSNINIRKYLK